MRTREEQMDAATALAGSGPAYLFYLAEAMEDAGQQLGFTPEEARRLVCQTLVGAAAMLAETSDGPAGLRATVTSKGGTTAAACDTLDELHVHDALVKAIGAAHERGRELGAA